jgi:FixJ family two-component response regulator
MSSTSTVFIVDDDPRVRKALTRLLRTVGLETLAFPSAEAFLEQHDPAMPGCVVLDLAMPGLNGLEAQQALTDGGCGRPIIFLTGQSDIATSVRAMKAGAVDFLTKPVNGTDLLVAVRNALKIDHAARQAEAVLREIRRRLATLSSREREVLARVVAGRLNKQIAAELGTVEKTIKVHRSHVMEKMGAGSLAELVRLVERAKIALDDSRLPDRRANDGSDEDRATAALPSSPLWDQGPISGAPTDLLEMGQDGRVPDTSGDRRR